MLGVLIEKELTTPDYYPMTLNALTAGCNQKSNRDPVVQYGTDEVASALKELGKAHLIGRSSGAGSRTIKYRHAVAEHLRLTREQRALLACLMLRGPQSIGELRTRTTRMVNLPDLTAAREVVEALIERDPPLVSILPVQPGRKEARLSHLMGSVPPTHSAQTVASPEGEPAASVAVRPTDLRSEVEDLKDRLEKLERAFDKFRHQFD